MPLTDELTILDDKIKAICFQVQYAFEKIKKY